MRFRTLVASCLALGLLASACSEQVLDTGGIANDLSETLTQALGRQISVTCPAEVPLEEGDTFTCEAQEPDGSFEILVEQTDDEGNVSARRKSIDPAEIEAKIAASIRAFSSLEITVECPDDIEVGEGKSFECEASSERGSQTITVTQQDDFGTVTYDAGD